MSSKERIRAGFDSVIESLNEQVWFQQLKEKWEELDPQSRLYLKFAAAGGGVLLVFILILSSIWSVHSLKRELAEKRDLLKIIQDANDEIAQLKRSLPSGGNIAAQKDLPPWSNYFETLAAGAGLDKASLSVGSEKAGNSSDLSKEALMDLSIKHVSIKQMIRYILALESGQRPVKLRNLTIDTKGDPAGYLDATLSVSAFTVVVPQ